MTSPDSFKTIIEPFKIKTVEPIRMTSRGERDASTSGSPASTQTCSRA